VWRWLGKSRADSHVHDSNALPGEENGRDSKFRLESLEPRLLLSGDPVLAELARWAESDGGTSDAEELAVIFQEIDHTSAAGVTAGNGAEESARGGLTVAWPEGWAVAADNPGINEIAKQIRFAESGPVDLLAMVAELVGHVLDNSATSTSVASVKSDGSQGEDGHQAGDDFTMVADLVDHALDIYTTSTSETPGESNGSQGEDGHQAGDEAAITNSITSEQLDLVLDKVVEALSSISTDGELADRLGDITIKLADLAEGVIAEIRGNVILIDIAADGHGWFLDALLEYIGAAGDSRAADETGTVSEATVAEQVTGELVARQEQSGGQDKTIDESAITLVGHVAVETNGSSENRQSPTEGEGGRTDRDASVDSESVAENSYTRLLPQVNTEAGEQGTTSSPSTAASSPADLMEQVLDLIGLATGLHGEIEPGEDNSEHIVGLLAASHRLQESNRSTRSELRKDNSKTVSGGESGQDQGSQATESETAVTAEGGEDAAPRGPPAIEEIQTITEDGLADTVQGVPAVSLYYDEETPETDSSDAEMPRAPPLDSEMPRAPPAVADMPRAPPANADTADYLLYDGSVITSGTEIPLTDEQLSAIFQEALRIWSSSTLATDLADRLNAITVGIAELDGGILGEARGDTLYIDSDAAGYGWFVDTTPEDNNEFGISLDAYRLLADAGSDADGRVDLLTVLLHEIGHVLGYGHDSGLAVMGEKVGNGERVGLGEPSLATLGYGGGDAGPVSGMLVTGIAPNVTLDLTPSADDATSVVVTVNPDGTINVFGSAGDDGASPISDVIEIKGNINGTLEIVGPDVDVIWNLDGADSGSLTIVSGATITFSNVDTLTGGSGTDTLIGPEMDAIWNVTGANAGIVASVAFSGIENLEGGSVADVFVFAGGSVAATSGGGGADTLDLSADAAGVVVDLAAGTASYAGTISGIENVVTGSGNDTLLGALGATILDTGAGTDTLDLDGIASDLTVTLHADGTLLVTDGSSVVENIAGAENVIGGTGETTVVFEDGAVLLGTLSAAGGLTLDYSAYTTAVTVNLTTGAATGTGGVSNLAGVKGGAVDDTFTFEDGSDFAGSIDGGGGNDTLDYEKSTGALSIDLASQMATGVSGFVSIETVKGGTGVDTLTGPATGATWVPSAALRTLMPDRVMTLLR
jgi:hypothetical protein